MKKTIFILLIAMIAFGLIFGCDETTNAPNTNNDNSGNVVTQPDTTNTNNGAEPAEEIPMPPALPE